MKSSLGVKMGGVMSKILLATIGLTLIFSSNLMADASQGVKIFSLLRPDASPEVIAPELSELKDSIVYGLSWRFRWKTIEPQEGQYNWGPIDKAIEITTKAGKKVMLRVVPGINTPEWVYQAGARPFEFSSDHLAHGESFSKNLTMPIPWDEIYLAKWENFVRAFGQRYSGNSHIYSIQMAGGGLIAEMNLPKVKEKWQQVGYSDEKLVAAWKRIIDAYQRAFPDIPTNLNVNEPLPQSHVLGPVVAYVLATYPHKVYLQEDALKADFPRNHRIRQIIREASAKTVVGYQLLGGKGFLEQQTGDRLAAFRNALEDHVSYLEVYASDVRDPGQRGALQSLTTQQQ
jgi:Beta-galactosidase